METDETDYNPCSLTQFKSYYVVWKLTNTSLSDISVKGLNRTMQYGN